MTNLFVLERPTDLPPDWREREQTLDIRRSFLVEAPAGSGKTGLLIQRYLKLLGDELVTHPEQVLAITFTNKAAAEMRERVLAQLQAATDGLECRTSFEKQTRQFAEEVLAKDRQLGWSLLERPEQLNLRTIDSVCSHIANSLPVLSGSGGSLSPTDEATELYLEAARRTILQLGGEHAKLDEALQLLLLHRDGNLRECERLIAEMLALRDQWGKFIPLSGEELDDDQLDAIVLPRLERTLDRIICATLQRLVDRMPQDLLRDLTELSAELGHAPGCNGEPSPIALCAGLRSSPRASAEHLAHWRALIHLLTTQEGRWRAERGINKKTIGFEYDRKHPHHAALSEILGRLGHREDLLAILEQVRHLPPAHYPNEQWKVAKALFRILSRALVELQLVFAERGSCDFVQVALVARSALLQESGPDDLAVALGMRYQHLLVDEMQDTSSSQYELLELLTQGWDGHSQTVFLVGDPKQSIYLFRQARVERFLGMMQTGFLGEISLDVLRLTANFRSQETLVEQINDDLSQIFPAAAEVEHPAEVPFVAAQATRKADSSSGLIWRTMNVPYGLPAEEERRVRQRLANIHAQEIRRVAQEWRSRTLPTGRTSPWKIAVLVRSRSHLIEIVSALKEIPAVPFRAIEIEPLSERPEVLDLFALTRALMHPADRIAWLAVLRAPWCGMTLADLHRLTGSDDTGWEHSCVEDLISAFANRLSLDGQDRVARVFGVMQSAEGLRGRLSTAQWVERTWRSLGGHLYLAEEQRANVDRYLQLLDAMEDHAPAGSIDLRRLEEHLQKLYAQSPPQPGAIDLMTIHGAKGLEWDAVFVPALERRSSRGRNQLLTWIEVDPEDEETAPVILAPIPGKGEASRELNDWIRSIRSARETAEQKRLLYVACTRAREALYLFATAKTRKDGSFDADPGTLLRAAWPAAHRYFLPSDEPEQVSEGLSLAAAGETKEESFTSQSPFLYRLPATIRPLEENASSPLPPAAAPSLRSSFDRPEGSFAARAFGNTVHLLIELLIQRIAEGQSREKLLAEISTWEARIRTFLRFQGLPAHEVERAMPRVQSALKTMLHDPEGLWLLKSHPSAATEYAITAWEELRTTVRIDRIFRAGETPLSEGKEYLWVVDFKTATHGREGTEEFLEKEHGKYQPQLETYAKAIGEEKIRLALYYPLLPKLLWWRFS